MERQLLQRRFTPERVRRHLIPRDAWRPFPAASERAPWEALPAWVRDATLRQAEARLGASWGALPATLFLEYRRQGNRARYEAVHHPRRTMLADLVLGECVEGQGRFLDAVIDGVWALCEESFWGVPAHSYSPRFPETGLPDTAYRVVDLFAAETGALLAWTSYLLGASLGREIPVVPDRIVRDVHERILLPYRTIDDWRWLGKVRRPANNWNPWIHSNVLACTLLLESDPLVRESTVLRVIEGLDAFLDGYHADGGCDEGPGYWGRAGASLFDCLEWLWSASAGALDVYDEPLIQEIGRYLYRVHIGGPWYVNYADAAARLHPDADLVYRYGRRIGDPRLMAHGAYVASIAPSRLPGQTSIGRRLPALFNAAHLDAAEPAPPLVREAWLGGIEVITAREREGTTDGLFFSAKGGHNAESHNHNDVGTFVVALDGHPVVIDVGVETYRRQTFSAERYEIWTMQSLYHNVPAVDGQGQHAGRTFAARDVVAEIDDNTVKLSLDIATAYGAEAGIERWWRTVRLDRRPRDGDSNGAQVVLEDAYRLARPAPVALHLMVSGPAAVDEAGLLRCATPGRPLLVRYDPQRLAPRVETIQIDDARLRSVWGERIYRVVFDATAPSAEGAWTLTMRAG